MKNKLKKHKSVRKLIIYRNRKMKDKNILHLQKTMTHIQLVRQACMSLNEYLDDSHGLISYEEIKNHDASKFSEIEVKGYVKQFYTDDKDSLEWKVALMHHYKNNPHHWQYWIVGFKVPYSEQQCKPLDMPSEQILIMVADWLAAGYQYSGSTDISNWLNDNFNKMVLSDKTKDIIKSVLSDIGLQFVVDKFKMVYFYDDCFLKVLEKDFDKISNVSVM